jgi:hypothetical protein
MSYVKLVYNECGRDGNRVICNDCNWIYAVCYINMDFALRSASGRSLSQIRCFFSFAMHMVPLATQIRRHNSS